MAWGKVDDRFGMHRKAIEAGNAACGLWARALAHVSGQLSDGFISDKEARLFAESPKQIEALVEAGLWEAVPGGYLFHDFEDFNPTRRDVEERRRKRAEAGRMGGRASGRSRRREATTQASASTNAEASASRVASTTDEPRTRTRPVPEPIPIQKETGGKGSPPVGQVEKEFQGWLKAWEVETGSTASDVSLARLNFAERRAEGVALADLQRAAKVAATSHEFRDLSAGDVLSRFKIGRLLAAPKPKRSAFPELERNAEAP